MPDPEVEALERDFEALSLFFAERGTERRALSNVEAVTLFVDRPVRSAAAELTWG